MNIWKTQKFFTALIILFVVAGAAWWWHATPAAPSAGASMTVEKNSTAATAPAIEPVSAPAVTPTAALAAAPSPAPYAAPAAANPTATAVAREEATVLVSITCAAPGGGQETIRIVREEGGPYPLIRTVEKQSKNENGPVIFREQMVADHVMVRLQPGVTAEEAAAALPQVHGLALRKIVGKQGHALLTFADAASDPDALPRAMAALNARKDLVRYAEPDFIVTVEATPNDPRYLDGSLWGLHNTGQTAGTADAYIDAPEGWDTRTDAYTLMPL